MSNFRLIPINEFINQDLNYDWQIEGVFECNTLINIVGDSGSYKSFLAIDLALCIATGSKWQGHEVKQTGRVIYVAGEGHNGLTRRMTAWCQTNGFQLEDLDLHISNQAANCFSDLDSLIKELDKVGSNIKLIIIDTLARNIGAGNESSTHDMTTFVNNMDKLKNRYGSTIMILHHTPINNSQRARGSNTLKGAVDYEFLLRKKANLVEFSCAKSKDHEPCSNKTIKPVSVVIVDQSQGEPITSLVLRLDESKLNDKGYSGKNQSIIMNAFNLLLEKVRTEFCESGQDEYHACVPYSDLLKESGITKKRFDESLKGLVKNNKICKKGSNLFPV